MTTHARTKRTALAALLLCGAAATPVRAGELAKGDTSDKTIAFSNSYAGNSFRQVMIKSFEETAAQAVKDKIVKGTTVVSANNSVTEQASQIQNLILQGYSAIAVLAGSDTALNGVVKDACDAGIVVVAFASGVTEPCAYRVDYDLDSYGKAELDYLAGRLGTKDATLLEIRGQAGDGFDKRLHEGVLKALKDHPAYKIANEVYGNWTATVAQKEVSGVLPSLPKIDGVLTQGGDGYGAAMAFKSANRPLPVIVMGNRQDELALWKQEHAANGYETFSLGATPSVSQVAFWVAQQILAGKKVPKFVEVPLLRIDQADLDAWLAHVPDGGVVNATYGQQLVADIIDANIDHKPLPGVPAPK
ncbi:ABC transporter substrate-binding protein [Lichenihabitans sp. Uapishka_5]|uniref:ABC transporter substrate-binding protein n=1 Tax=Lichenihabitans sp. Uapishka_5 TaxID=3037302 RepID=UPI0029E7D9B9|nr:ABC transporter substrate-binding protein [Lichenihabitans sp. Uapishka_5]MDX7950851.1 ABC transporter substrate-binding protein [Lichenihabitans sp. Uapishka_5]